jgi:hypothetical protein
MGALRRHKCSGDAEFNSRFSKRWMGGTPQRAGGDEADQAAVEGGSRVEVK